MALPDLKKRYSVALNPLRTERRLELVVVVVAALLGLQIVWGIASRLVYSGPEAIRPASDGLAVSSLAEQVVPAEAASQEILARPFPSSGGFAGGRSDR